MGIGLSLHDDNADQDLPVGVTRARYPSGQGCYHVRIRDLRVGRIVAAKYFTDRQHGSAAAARQAALDWYHAQLARRGLPAVQPRRRRRDAGVSLSCHVRSNWSLATNWLGTWYDGTRQHKKAFSAQRYGYAGAFWRALAWRLQQGGEAPAVVRVPAPTEEAARVLALANVSWRRAVGATCPPAWQAAWAAQGRTGDPGVAWLEMLPTLAPAALAGWLASEVGRKRYALPEQGGGDGPAGMES